MTTLAEYLTHKRDAFRALRSRVLSPGYEPVALRAQVTAERRSGVRRIRLRDHQVLADSPRDFLGYDLGPSSPELALGALGRKPAALLAAAGAGLPAGCRRRVPWPGLRSGGRAWSAIGYIRCCG